MRPLTEHFSLEEMTVTQQRGMDNTPLLSVVSNLYKTAQFMEQVRSMLGHPIIITSGYRSPLVNKAVGGAANSDHMNGLACDFICPKFGSPLEICRVIQRSGLKYDQLIMEGTWVHVGLGHRMRQQTMGVPSEDTPRPVDGGQGELDVGTAADRLRDRLFNSRWFTNLRRGGQWQGI